MDYLPSIRMRKLLKLSVVFRFLNLSIFKLLVHAIAFCFPVEKWYAVVLFISKISRFKLTHIVIKKYPLGLIKAFDVNTLLSLLTRKGRYFPIPYRIRGLDLLDHNNGLVLCTVHIPLIKVAICGLIENEFKVDAVIVGEPIPGGKMSVWGITHKIPILLRNLHVLLKAKNLLQKNESVLLMVDQGAFGSYSPNILKLCGKLGSKLVFLFAELQVDGTVETYVTEAPFPYCKNSNEIEENLKYLKQASDEIVLRYQNQSIF